MSENAWAKDVDFTKSENLLSPLKAMRAKCRNCCCGQVSEIRDCNIETCPLWPYRMGKRPETAGVWKGTGTLAAEEN